MTTRLTAGEVGTDETVNGGYAPGASGGSGRGDEIFYPDTDGVPMAENDSQANAMHYTHGALLEWAGRLRDRDERWRNAYVGMDLLIYYIEGDHRASIAPDNFIMFDAIPKESRLWWKIWEENGVAPGFVLEFSSPTTWKEDAIAKRDKYRQLGVDEYWRQDPVGGIHYPALIGERLVDGVYEPIEVYTDESGMLRGRSEVLGLDMCVRPDGEFRLYDPVGDEWLSSHDEALEGRREAEARAETAEARLEDLESENRRLRGLLREAGRGDHPHPSPLPEGEGIK